MIDYVDFEIDLQPRGENIYAVEFRYQQPDSEAGVRPESGKIKLDPEEFTEYTYDPDHYGRLLTKRFFSDQAVVNAFLQAQASAEVINKPLRLRMLINQDDERLHNLYWETLQDPKSAQFLTLNENLVFSRFPKSDSWKPVKLRHMSQLQALVVVANPIGLSEYGLAEIDVEKEITQVKRSLGAIRITTLPNNELKENATLDNIIISLRRREYDILYMVCHGTFSNNQSWLWLENDDGKVDRVSGEELAIQISSLQRQPMLVVLASCQSSGRETGNALTALGPRLAGVGVPAVIAMQGNISMETASAFMTKFFTELQHYGVIDRAMTVARTHVRNRIDFWVPVLFMRLENGQVWIAPGFSSELRQWPSLIRYINNKKCTPILGPGLYESLLGSQREIAQQWADAENYPLQQHARESLPQVAQYLAVEVYEREPYERIEDHLERYVYEKYYQLFPAPFEIGTMSLDELIEYTWEAINKDEFADPYEVLAKLPLPIYITTNLNNLLASALRKENKEPQVELCPWNEFTEEWNKSESIFRREKAYIPSPDRPLVYHLFGQLNKPESVVLTEDDYFDFLIGVTLNRDSIPPAIRRSLVDSTLLFLGFQLYDWQFRVLFRSILSHQGNERRRSYPHVAVQIAPDKISNQDPEAARSYLEKYYFKSADISIYWGSVQLFVQELLVNLNKKA